MASITLDEKQMEGKPRKVGTWSGRPVFHMRTKGGWQLIATQKNDGTPEILGVGSHRGLAMHIAEKNAKGIEWTTLAKAGFVDPIYFEWMLPRWETITDQLRALGG